MQFVKKNFAESLFQIILVAFLVMAPLSIIYAEFSDACPDGEICNPLASKGIDSVPGFIEILLTGVIRAGIPIVALAIIYCGFLFVQARGNSEALKKAKDALLYTLIGAAILLGSWAIAKLISDTVLAL